jgi:hypothetical protein
MKKLLESESLQIHIKSSEALYPNFDNWTSFCNAKNPQQKQPGCLEINDRPLIGW